MHLQLKSFYFIKGVRFPDQVVTVSTRADGSEQRVQVDFEAIEVNLPVDRKGFRVPTITRKSPFDRS